MVNDLSDNLGAELSSNNKKVVDFVKTLLLDKEIPLEKRVEIAREVLIILEIT